MLKNEIDTRYSTKCDMFLYSTEMGRDILLLKKPENRNKETTTRLWKKWKSRNKEDSFINLVEKYAMLSIVPQEI